MFSYLPLGHCYVLDIVFKCPEHQGHLVCQVYVVVSVRYLMSFPVELDAFLPQDSYSFIIPFGGCRLLV